MARWIGVDLDGTLAHYDHWRGIDHVGEPIPEMIDRVKAWIDAGIIVKIFTARASKGPGAIVPIKAWLRDHGLPDLEVTNVKDFGLLELWDDRAMRVINNTGECCCDYTRREY